MKKVVFAFEELSSDLQPMAGGKGGSLGKLCQAGFPVPEGFVVLAGAFSEDRLQPEAWEQVQEQLEALRAGDEDQAFAVRSSALSEDSEQASFAGEFESRLNLSSDEGIREAIHQVHQSRHGEKVQAYSRAKGLSEAHEMAVVVQRLVDADRSGVLFTANPTNGDRSQAMISAAWGLGEAIVSGTVTPDMVTVGKDTGRVISFQVAAKEAMTVRTAAGTEDRPVQGRRQKQAVLSKAEAIHLSTLGSQIEALYGMPMDIEWAATADKFWILQARPITAIPDPPPPTKWKLPKGAYMAMRVNIIELMAEPLSPLFETMGLEIINASMKNLMKLFLGEADIMPDEPIISVNHCAYYNGSLKLGSIAKVLLNSVGIAKRMFTAPVERWTEEGRPEYVSVVEEWEASDWRQRTNSGIMHASRELIDAAIDAYWSMVSGVLPGAWITEALFTFYYRALVKRRQDPEAFTFLLGFDSLPIQADKSLYALATWARKHEALSEYLAEREGHQLAEDLGSEDPPAGVPEADWHAWRQQFRTHLAQYGHTVYDLDFGNPVPADDPAPLLETCKMYLIGEGKDPGDRQQAAVDRREASISAVHTRLKGWRLKQFDRFLALAQRFVPMRENALADVGFAYPLVRRMIHFLGARLTEAGAIERPEEVYWLTSEEVAAACEKLDRNLPLGRLSVPIPERMATLRAARKATPPRSLPDLSLPGLKKLMARLSRGKERSVLRGVGASAGSVTAVACVLRGPEDFDQMESGGVLVAALTTPAWTPLFARAAAIVTDIGGPLSHGSIVAREYGIPAVLGTGQATQQIQTGQRITVDGSEGKVYLQPDGN